MPMQRIWSWLLLVCCSAASSYAQSKQEVAPADAAALRKELAELRSELRDVKRTLSLLVDSHGLSLESIQRKIYRRATLAETKALLAPHGQWQEFGGGTYREWQSQADDRGVKVLFRDQKAIAVHQFGSRASAFYERVQPGMSEDDILQLLRTPTQEWKWDVGVIWTGTNAHEIRLTFRDDECVGYSTSFGGGQTRNLADFFGDKTTSYDESIPMTVDRALLLAK